MARLGFQMVMLRDHADVAGTLKLAVDIGYDIAEPWGWKEDANSGKTTCPTEMAHPRTSIYRGLA